MSIAFTFTTNTRMQWFEIRRIAGGLSFTRTSYVSTSSRWFAFTTNAYLTTNGTRDGALRQSSEHMNFSMGKSSEKFPYGDDELADSQSDYVYDYEAEMTLLHGDGVYIDHKDDGSYTTDAPTSWEHSAPKYTSWPICECADPSCVHSQRFTNYPF